MPDPSLPPPESCLHNLHRAADRERDPPDPTDMCRNGLGAFHMLDCPLFLGRPCAWYEEAARPHPSATDAAIATARDELRRDFLGWSYRQRVRNLAKPPGILRQRIVLEAAAGAVEEVEQPLVLKVPLIPAPDDDDAAPVSITIAAVAEGTPGGAPLAPTGAGVAIAMPITEGVAPIESPLAAPPTASEMYPGQRRSEDRSTRKKPRRPTTPQFAAPAAGQGAAPRGGAAAADGGRDEGESGDDAFGDDAFGDEIEGDRDEPEVEIQTVVPMGPKTVEQYLAILPEAKLPDGERQRPPRRDERGPRDHGGGRQGRPRGPSGGQQGGQHGGRPQYGPHGGRQGGGGQQRPPRPHGQGPGQPQRHAGAPGGGPGAQHGAPPGGSPPGAGAPRSGRGRRRRGRRPGDRPQGPPREGDGPPPQSSPPPSPRSPE